MISTSSVEVAASCKQEELSDELLDGLDGVGRWVLATVGHQRLPDLMPPDEK